MSNQLRVPPQNIDAEQALLGSILLRPEALTNIAEELPPEAFYVNKHQTLYRAMLDLYFADEPIDTLTIAAKMNTTNTFEKIGGNNFLLDLTNAVPTSTNAEYYAKVILEAYTRRQLISTGDLLSKLGFDETQQLEEVIDQAEKEVFNVTQHQSGNTVHKIGDVLPKTFESVERLSQAPDGIRGVATGFKDLDYKLSGLQKADLIILAARPSMGKTSLALDIARQSAVQHNTKTLIFSLEMSAQSLVDRLVAAEAHVDLRKIKTGQGLTEQDFENMRHAMGRLNDATIHIDDQAGNNILRMRATARRMAAREGLDLIVVDYLQLMTTTRHIDNVVQQVSEISRSLKALGRELDVPILSLSQLSRAVESRGGRPRLSDLRDSGAIEQDADVVMFIHREADEENGGKVPQAELLIEKHRNGATGKIDLYFEGSRTSFITVEKNDYSHYGVDTSEEEVYA